MRSYIKCPSLQIKFRTQGSNPYYGKLKIEGAGRILSVVCNNREWQRSMDGYFIGNGARFNCGVNCRIQTADFGVVTRTVPGSLFGSGGGC